MTISTRQRDYKIKVEYHTFNFDQNDWDMCLSRHELVEECQKTDNTNKIDALVAAHNIQFGDDLSAQTFYPGDPTGDFYAYDYRHPKECMTDRSWRDRLWQWNEGCCYDPLMTLVLPRDCVNRYSFEDPFSPTTQALLNQHQDVLSTPAHDLPEDIQKSIQASAKSTSTGVFASKFFNKNKEGAHQTMVFVSANDASDWVGFVTYTTETVWEETLSMTVVLEMVFINPKYRGMFWGPVIAAMCGELIYKSMWRSGFYLDPRLPSTKEVKLFTEGEAVFEYSEHIILSFGAGVHLGLHNEYKFRDDIDRLVTDGELKESFKMPPVSVERTEVLW